jgi:hypothetical protein
MRPAEVRRLTERLTREVMSDLLTGRRRQGTDRRLVRALGVSSGPRPHLVEALRRRQTGSSTATGPVVEWRREHTTFVPLNLTRDELDELAGRAADDELSVSDCIRAALGWPRLAEMVPDGVRERAPSKRRPLRGQR